MQVKSKSGRLITLPTKEEDKAITKAALSDPDSLPWTEKQLANLNLKRPRGRPFGSGTKKQVTLRVDSDVLESFKVTGDGWQTRINDALREWLKSHKTAA